jgi:DNA-directed RNA polymerase sigma subunit (sigma70/sigma32)
LGLTRERVRQIETEALNRMADSMEQPSAHSQNYGGGDDF